MASPLSVRKTRGSSASGAMPQMLPLLGSERPGDSSRTVRPSRWHRPSLGVSHHPSDKADLRPNLSPKIARLPVPGVHYRRSWDGIPLRRFGPAPRGANRDGRGLVVGGDAEVAGGGMFAKYGRTLTRWSAGHLPPLFSGFLGSWSSQHSSPASPAPPHRGRASHGHRRSAALRPPRCRRIRHSRQRRRTPPIQCCPRHLSVPFPFLGRQQHPTSQPSPIHALAYG